MQTNILFRKVERPGTVVRVATDNEEDPVVFEVRETSDYKKFKHIDGNRQVIDSHVLRLVRSFEQRYLVRIIIVNEKFQVIDGQHSLEGAERTGKPVRYVVVPGYGLKEVQIYNTNVATWKKSDYLQSYADLGLEPYLLMQEFMNDYPEFGIGATEVILTQLYRGSNNTVSTAPGKKLTVKTFEEGGLEIPDYEQSKLIADKILEFKPFYQGFNRLVFVRTILTLLKHPAYNHKQMISKLGYQSTKLVDCSNVEQYKMLLEDIYNFRQSKKVSFRYA